jgi:hypothetical protein
MQGSELAAFIQLIRLKETDDVCVMSEQANSIPCSGILTMKSVTVDRVSGCLRVQASPILRLDASDSADSCNRRVRGGAIQQAVRGFAHKGLGHSQSRLRDGLEVVSTFQANGQLSIGKGHEHVSHLSIARWCDEAAAQDITGCSIEASRNCQGQMMYIDMREVAY